MNAERQPVAGTFDRLQHAIEPVGGVAHHMQDRSEHLFCQLIGIGQFEDMRRDVNALRRSPGEMHTRFFFHSGDMGPQLPLGFIVNHGPDLGGQFPRIADSQFARSACNHLDHAIGDIVLNEQQP